MNKEKRKEIRTPLMSETAGVTCESLASQGILMLAIDEISPNGVFVKSARLPKINELVTIRFEMPSELGIIELEAIVKWTRWAVKKDSKLPIGFGLEFKYSNDKKDLIMISYCTYLRNKQIIQVSKRIIEAFFPKGPIL